jgi:hypothetical protein
LGVGDFPQELQREVQILPFDELEVGADGCELSLEGDK